MPDARQPVTLGMSLGTAPQPGSLVTVKVRIRVAPGHHVYGTDEQAKTYTPLSLDLKLPEGWRTTGDWRLPASIAKDGHQIMTGDFIARRAVFIPPGVTGDFKVSCDLRAQACNAELCWPPKTLTAETTVRLATPSPAQP